MKERFDTQDDRAQAWKKIIGLGERSIRKSYYPELQQQIVELKRAYRELQESETKYRILVESTSDAMAMLDIDRTIVSVNQAFLRLFGYREGEVEGKSARIIHQSEEHFNRFGSLFYPVVDKTGFVSTEWDMIRKDGLVVPCDMVVYALRDSDGRTTGYGAICRDITERRRAEAALREAHDELEARVRERTAELQDAYERLEAEMAERKEVEEQLRQSQKIQAIGTLAGGIAHDFNNMLAVIIGNAELAHEDVEDWPAPRHNIEQILAASKRARDLVKQILAFSRKTGREENPLRLKPLIEETTKMLRGSLPSTIHLELEASTKSDTIVGDSAQIQQVLMNLATNAAHAMREKGGTLSICLSEAVIMEGAPAPDPDMRPGLYAKLTVSDTGSGMGADVLKRIFEPFFTTKEPGQGTGMGLPVAYGIVKDHGGAITAESTPGKGSTFTVFLPCVPASACEAGEAEEEHVPGGNERVLLVDDEPLVAEVASNTLKRLGYDVTTAGGGVEALEKFRKAPDRFDLVITDQVMPDLTGMDLASRMLATRSDVPIILITGYSETTSPEEVASAGIKEFVTKPVSSKEIAETIRRVLHR